MSDTATGWITIWPTAAYCHARIIPPLGPRNMNCLSIGDLAEFSGGRLRLSRLPPLGGTWEPIRRIQIELEQIAPGDVYWPLSNQTLGYQEAFARGALGVVCEPRGLEPWAGRFTLEVKQLDDSLTQAAAAARRLYQGCLVTTHGLSCQMLCEVAARLGGDATTVQFAEVDSPANLARTIIHLDERPSVSVFTAHQTTIDARFGVDVHLTAGGSESPASRFANRVIECHCTESIDAAVAAIREISKRTKQNNPCEALPSMLDLRESNMPTLLGRSDDLADRWYLGRPPWQVLPGRA